MPHSSNLAPPFPQATSHLGKNALTPSSTIPDVAQLRINWPACEQCLTLITPPLWRLLSCIRRVLSELLNICALTEGPASLHCMDAESGRGILGR